MIFLGITQPLAAKKETAFGFYLTGLPGTAAPAQESDEDSLNVLDTDLILLPKAQVPEGFKAGDVLNVFVYKDSEDRPIATTAVPPLELGQLAKLPVKAVNNIGAFLDWGLAKDLFLPYREQTRPVETGDTVTVSLYIDKSQRLCATMKIYPYLSTSSPYQKDDWVSGTVYEILPNFGAYVAVDGCYSAMIPNKEFNTRLNVGETIHARVAVRHPDGKLGLSLNDKIPQQMSVDGQMIFEKLEAAGGFLPYHDKSDPEVIKEVFSLSKNAFKRAIGHLLKDGLITIEADGIRKK